MEYLVKDYVLIGFSTGGILSFVTTVEKSKRVAAIIAVCPPVEFRNSNMKFLPIVHGANRLVRSLSSSEGVMPFISNESEHPLINYRNIPIRGLYELGCLVSHVRPLLRKINCPTRIIQADRDPVVDPQSASIVYDLLGCSDKRILWVKSERHGILCENIENTQPFIVSFLESLVASKIQTG